MSNMTVIFLVGYATLMTALVVSQCVKLRMQREAFEEAAVPVIQLTDEQLDSLMHWGDINENAADQPLAEWELDLLNAPLDCRDCDGSGLRFGTIDCPSCGGTGKMETNNA